METALNQHIVGAARFTQHQSRTRYYSEIREPQRGVGWMTYLFTCALSSKHVLLYLIHS
jgi:hypothetical protein